MTIDDPALTRLRLGVAYDGTDFSGWSEQPGRRTVQGEMEAALRTLFGRHEHVPTVTVAGRTDAGVHARGQVVHLDLTDEQIAQLQRPHRGMVDRSPLDAPTVLARRLNGLAGSSDEIVVSGARLAPPGFHARFGALWRRYEYRIADRGAERDPSRRRHTLWYDHLLDLDLMNATAAGLVGLHDWAAYCRHRDYATTIRELQHFSWRSSGRGRDAGRTRGCGRVGSGRVRCHGRRCGTRSGARGHRTGRGNQEARPVHPRSRSRRSRPRAR